MDLPLQNRWENYTTVECLGIHNPEHRVDCVSQHLNVSNPPSIYGGSQFQQLWLSTTCYLWNVSYGNRVLLADEYADCTVPFSGQDALLFMGLSMLVMAGLFNKLSAVWVLVVGAALGAVNARFDLLQLSNSISLWFGVQPPKLFFYVFLPPLLVDSAIRIDFFLFRKVLVHVLYSAFFMVLASALLLPPFILHVLGFSRSGWTWVHGALFASMIASTDAVASTSILKAGGGPERLVMILEGEAMLNDAMGLTLFEVFSAILQAYPAALAASAAASAGAGSDLLHLPADPSGAPSPLDVLPEILIKTLRLSTIGAATGLVAGLLTQRGLRSLRWRGAGTHVEVVVVLAVAYLSYYVSDALLGGSGVISVVAFGLYGAATRRWGVLARSEGTGAFVATWDTLAFAANAIVFMWSGVAAASDLIRSAPLLRNFPSTFYAVPILWAFMLLLRAGCLAIANPIFARSSGGRLTKADILFTTWSGLRGAVSLIMIADYAGLAREQRARHAGAGGSAAADAVEATISLWTSGFVLLTLLVNAPTIGALMHALRLDALPTERLRTRSRARRALLRFTQDALDSLRKDGEEFLAGTNWRAVAEYVDIRTDLTAFEVPQARKPKPAHHYKTLWKRFKHAVWCYFRVPGGGRAGGWRASAASRAAATAGQAGAAAPAAAAAAGAQRARARRPGVTWAPGGDSALAGSSRSGVLRGLDDGGAGGAGAGGDEDAGEGDSYDSYDSDASSSGSSGGSSDASSASSGIRGVRSGVNESSSNLVGLGSIRSPFESGSAPVQTTDDLAAPLLDDSREGGERGRTDRRKAREEGGDGGGRRRRRRGRDRTDPRESGDLGELAASRGAAAPARDSGGGGGEASGKGGKGGKEGLDEIPYLGPVRKRGDTVPPGPPQPPPPSGVIEDDLEAGRMPSQLGRLGGPDAPTPERSGASLDRSEGSAPRVLRRGSTLRAGSFSAATRGEASSDRRSSELDVAQSAGSLPSGAHAAPFPGGRPDTAPAPEPPSVAQAELPPTPREGSYYSTMPALQSRKLAAALRAELAVARAGAAAPTAGAPVTAVPAPRATAGRARSAFVPAAFEAVPEEGVTEPAAAPLALSPSPKAAPGAAVVSGTPRAGGAADGVHASALTLSGATGRRLQREFQQQVRAEQKRLHPPVSPRNEVERLAPWRTLYHDTDLLGRPISRPSSRSDGEASDAALLKIQAGARPDPVYGARSAALAGSLGPARTPFAETLLRHREQLSRAQATPRSRGRVGESPRGVSPFVPFSSSPGRGAYGPFSGSASGPFGAATAASSAAVAASVSAGPRSGAGEGRLGNAGASAAAYSSVPPVGAPAPAGARAPSRPLAPRAVVSTSARHELPRSVSARANAAASGVSVPVRSRTRPRADATPGAEASEGAALSPRASRSTRDPIQPKPANAPFSYARARVTRAAHQRRTGAGRGGADGGGDGVGEAGEGQGGGGLNEAQLNELRGRLLLGLQRYFHLKWLQGLLSAEGLRILEYACEEALERPWQPLSIWSGLEQDIRGGAGAKLVAKLAFHLSRLHRHLPWILQSPVSSALAGLRGMLGRRMLVACEVAVEYYLALLWSPQNAWMWDAEEGAALAAEVEAEVEAAHRFVLDREIEAPNTFGAIQSFRAAMALLRQQLDCIADLHDSGMLDKREKDAMDRVVDKRVRHLEITGPIWKPPRPREVLRGLPFLADLPGEYFEHLVRSGSIAEHATGEIFWSSSDEVSRTDRLRGPGAFVVVSGVVRQVHILPDGTPHEFYQGIGGVIGIMMMLTGAHLPGRQMAIAEGNVMGKGPVLYHIPQSVAGQLRREAARGGAPAARLERGLGRLAANYVLQSLEHVVAEDARGHLTALELAGWLKIPVLGAGGSGARGGRDGAGAAHDDTGSSSSSTHSSSDGEPGTVEASGSSAGTLATARARDRAKARRTRALVAELQDSARRGVAGARLVFVPPGRALRQSSHCVLLGGTLRTRAGARGASSARYIDESSRPPYADVVGRALRDGAAAAAGSSEVAPLGPFSSQPSGPFASQPSGPFASQPSGPFASQPSGPFASQPSGPFGPHSSAPDPGSASESDGALGRRGSGASVTSTSSRRSRRSSRGFTTLQAPRPIPWLQSPDLRCNRDAAAVRDRERLAEGEGTGVYGCAPGYTPELFGGRRGALILVVRDAAGGLPEDAVRYDLHGDGAQLATRLGGGFCAGGEGKV